MSKILIVVIASLTAAACSFTPPGNMSGSGGSGFGGRINIGGFGGSASQGPCVGLQCQQSTCKMGGCMQPACTGGVVTTLSGKVYDPAGKFPLSNVDVYIPNTALAPFTDGPSCDTCATNLSGDPIVKAKTDATGKFR